MRPSESLSDCGREGYEGGLHDAQGGGSTGQPPGELRATPFRGRLRSARFAHIQSAAHGRGDQIVKGQIKEETLHPL